VLTVSHREFLDLNYGELKAKDGVLFDIKSVLEKSIVDARL
jgi:UDP-N-acetyl-D-mannosaminuronate dehydrogenase